MREVGVTCTLRSLLEHLSGEDVLETVRSILQRHLAAHLDLGFCRLAQPGLQRGFFAAWKASAALDLAWELDELPGVRDEIHDLPDDPVLVLETELRSLLPDESLWLAISNVWRWSCPAGPGCSCGVTSIPAAFAGAPAPVDMVDYLAVRIFLERHLCTELIRRLTGAPLGFRRSEAYYQGNPAEFLVRYALHSVNLPEDLQAAAAGLCAATVDGREVHGWAGLAPRWP
jgi:uncharacterized protein